MFARLLILLSPLIAAALLIGQMIQLSGVYPRIFGCEADSVTRVFRRFARRMNAQVAEWLMAADCKSAALRSYGGSNPPLCTMTFEG